MTFTSYITISAPGQQLMGNNMILMAISSRRGKLTGQGEVVKIDPRWRNATKSRECLRSKPGKAGRVSLGRGESTEVSSTCDDKTDFTWSSKGPGTLGHILGFPLLLPYLVLTFPSICVPDNNDIPLAHMSEKVAVSASANRW